VDKNPLKIIQDEDAALTATLNASRDLAFCPEGTVPLKYRLLAAMVLDAAHGAANGVKPLARQAMDAGATTEEIIEFLRVVNYVSGAGSIYTAAAGLADIL
jgi:alkylhydroperoxidase/carboxymuconolactone decarboxylase family protein YurZ